jgi:hypothetical protein
VTTVALDLSSLQDAQRSAAMVTALSGKTPADLELRLELSAGTRARTNADPSAPERITVYRPWFVAAQLIDEEIFVPESTPDVTFRRRARAVASLMGSQSGVDRRLALEVPKGMDAMTAEDRLALETGYESGSAYLEVTV